MTQPELLTKDEPLFWSTGKGTDAWKMFCAAAKGDLETIKGLLVQDPSLIRSEFDYRNAMSFAVRENQPAIVEYLLSKNANPVNSGTEDTLLQIAKDRGYNEIQQMLEKATGTNATPGGAIMTAAIKSRDIEKVKALLDASPELLHAKDD